MESIPIFSGVSEDLGSWVTCGHFLSVIEEFSFKNNLTEHQMKELCQSKLSEYALELFQKNFQKSWSELKNIMFDNFPLRLTIREKVEVRKSLQQFDSEGIDDFYQRCQQAQYLVSDDVKDIGFEREVLLHFLIGLSPLIRDLVLATKCSSSNDYINEAKKYVQVIKEEPPEVNVKIEVDPLEDFCQFDEYGNHIVSEEWHSDLKIKPKSEIVVDGDQKSKFICDLCGKNFKNKQNMKFHIMNVHSPSKGILCIDCGKTFKNETSLNEHVKRVHSGAANKWKCELCHVTFYIKYKEKHSKLVHKQCNNCEKLYVNRYKHYKRWHSKSDTCWYCDFTGNDNKSLQIHMTENHLNTTRMKQKGWKKCEICNEAIKSKELLLDHQEKVHGHLKQTCEFCNEVFLTMKILAVHIANKHCTKIPDKGYVCLYCNLVTKTRASKVGYHIMNIHFNQPLYQCDQCSKGFDEKNSLVSHIKYNHTTEKLFQCDKCAKNFKTVGLLNSHVKGMHEQQEKATCKECNRIFKSSKVLRDHFRIMHSGGERTKYMCDDCGKSFLTKQNFQNHARIHLSEEEKEKLKITCQFPGCDYSTIIKELLDTHFKRVHEKVQNFQCSFCTKGFFTKGAMEQHTNGVHLNLKPFQCDLCVFASAYRSTLQEHKKVAHGTQGKWRQRSDTKRTPRF